MSATHPFQSLEGRTWPALLTLLTLACVTPPAPANASPAAASAPGCDGGPCDEQKPPPSPQPTSTPAAPVATPTEPAPTAAEPSTSPAASSTERSTQPQCDTDWPDGRTRVIQIEKRKDDGKPLAPFRPDDPMHPYDLRGSRYLFRDKGMIYTVAGRFNDDEKGEDALRTVEGWFPAARPFLTTPGAYLVTDGPTCKVTDDNRSNPTIDSASWVMEFDGFLLAATQSACSNGTLTKKVTVISCDGKKNLMTDSVTAPCEAGRIDTCIRPVVPGVVIFEHDYSMTGGTVLSLRVADLKRKRRLQIVNAAHEGGPETELLSVEDVDQDGVPELVYSLAGTGQRTRVLKWAKGRFVEARSP